MWGNKGQQLHTLCILILALQAGKQEGILRKVFKAISQNWRGLSCKNIQAFLPSKTPLLFKEIGAWKFFESSLIPVPPNNYLAFIWPSLTSNKTQSTSCSSHFSLWPDKYRQVVCLINDWKMYQAFKSTQCKQASARRAYPCLDETVQHRWPAAVYSRIPAYKTYFVREVSQNELKYNNLIMIGRGDSQFGWTKLDFIIQKG